MFIVHLALVGSSNGYVLCVMSAHVLLNLLNELGKRHTKRGLPSIYLLFPTRLINSIIQAHEC